MGLGSAVPQVWETLPAVTAPETSVNGLTSGDKYWFRVAPVGAAGQGAWSDAVRKVAP